MKGFIRFGLLVSFALVCAAIALCAMGCKGTSGSVEGVEANIANNTLSLGKLTWDNRPHTQPSTQPVE